MRISRTVIAAGLLAVEAGLAALAIFVHYGLTAEYGDVTDSALEGLWAAFSTGIGAIALVLIGLPALVAMSVGPRLWMRLTALAIPVLMTLGMLAVTPIALREKLQVQYAATPQCVSGEEMGRGPGLRAARESQRAFESIDHVGYFGGGGASGVGGCDRSFVLTQDVDVLHHYRAALRDAGWRIVADDAHHLRAERDGMAFEVVSCAGGGVVWAGRLGHSGGARCDQQ